MIQQSHFCVHTQRIESRNSDIFTPTFTAALNHSDQKVEAIQVFADGGTDKQNVGYTRREYYSAFKRNKILTHATT